MIAKSYNIEDLPKKLTRLGIYDSSYYREHIYHVIESGTARIELMLEGRGWVRNGNHQQEVLAGDLLWHIHGDETISRNDPINPYICLSIEFKVPDGKKRIAPRFSHWESVESARTFTREAIAWHADSNIDRQALLHYICGALLIRTRSSINRQLRPRPSVQVRQIINSLEANYRTSKTLGTIAKEIGCSLTHLHNTVKAATGLTPHEIVTARRMSAAKEQLAGTHKQIKEIAINCGFGTAAAFCNRFKSLYKESPQAYRKQQTGQSSLRLPHTPNQG